MKSTTALAFFSLVLCYASASYAVWWTCFVAAFFETPFRRARSFLGKTAFLLLAVLLCLGFVPQANAVGIQSFDVSTEQIAGSPTIDFDFTQVFSTYTASEDQNISFGGNILATAGNFGQLRGEMRVNGILAQSFHTSIPEGKFTQTPFSTALSLAQGDTVELFVRSQTGTDITINEIFSNLDILSSNTIPEPTTCTLALAALCLAIGRRRAF